LCIATYDPLAAPEAELDSPRHHRNGVGVVWPAGVPTRGFRRVVGAIQACVAGAVIVYPSAVGVIVVVPATTGVASGFSLATLGTEHDGRGTSLGATASAPSAKGMLIGAGPAGNEPACNTTRHVVAPLGLGCLTVVASASAVQLPGIPTLLALPMPTRRQTAEAAGSALVGAPGITPMLSNSESARAAALHHVVDVVAARIGANTTTWEPLETLAPLEPPEPLEPLEPLGWASSPCRELPLPLQASLSGRTSACTGGD
jgi:hypothetical protein